MKELVSIVEPDDSRWNESTEEPIKKFIKEPNTGIVIIFYEQVREIKEKIKRRDRATIKKEEKRKDSIDESAAEDILMWDQLIDEGDEDEDDSLLQAELKMSEKLGLDVPEQEADGMRSPNPEIPTAPIEDEKLMVLNEVVSHNSPDLYYFVKLWPTKLTNANFLEVCIFGEAPDGDLSNIQLPPGTHLFLNNLAKNKY